MGALVDKVRKSLFGEPVLQQANVTSEVRNAGTAFAALIEGVGKAVATTQRELDSTSGNIASVMAQTEVDTVQAIVTEYGDSGNIKDVNVVTGKTSALSIAVPAALSFKRVHLEASFVATEFSSAEHSNVNVNLVGVNVSSKGAGISGPKISASFVNANTDSQTEQTQDSSVGSMSMTAQILPKPVLALTKPPLILKGPQLTLSAIGGSKIDNINPLSTDPTAPPYLERRTMVILVKLMKADGTTPNNGKTIAIDSAGLDWEVTDSLGAAVTPVTAGPTTLASGDFYIKVSRISVSAAEAKKDYVLRASLNLVNATLSVSL